MLEAIPAAALSPRLRPTRRLPGVSQRRGRPALPVLLVLLSAVALPSAAAAQVVGVLLRPVAVTGDASPDGDGLFNMFQQPTINDQGNVAFSATFSGSFNIGGIAVDRSTGLEIVARTNDPAPDGNGSLFSFGLGPVPINGSGRVAFVNTLTGTSGGFADATRILTADGSTLRQVVRRGQAAPDGNGNFDTFDQIGIADDGDAFFWASFVNTNGGFFVDDRGVYRGDGIADLGPAPLDEILRAGDLIGPSNLVIGNIDPQRVATHAHRWTAIWAFLTNSPNPPTDSLLLLLDDGLTLSVLAQLGDPLPDGNGTLFGIGASRVARDGRVSMNATFDNSALGLSDNMGVLSFDPLGNDAVLVREGDALPGGNGETFAVDFDDAAGFASTQTAPNRAVFHGFVNGSAGGTLTDEGLFLARNGDVLVVVREGDPAPTPGVDDGEFELLRLNQAHVNAAGTVAFYAQVRNETTLGDGVFRWSPASGITNIARVGQPLLGSTIQNVFFMDDLATRRAGVSPMNALGEITLRVRLQDGREAILATNGVPEPEAGAAVGLLALAHFAVARARRRRIA